MFELRKDVTNAVGLWVNNLLGKAGLKAKNTELVNVAQADVDPLLLQSINKIDNNWNNISQNQGLENLKPTKKHRGFERYFNFYDKIGQENPKGFIFSRRVVADLRDEFADGGVRITGMLSKHFDDQAHKIQGLIINARMNGFAQEDLIQIRRMLTTLEQDWAKIVAASNSDDPAMFLRVVSEYLDKTYRNTKNFYLSDKQYLLLHKGDDSVVESSRDLNELLQIKEQVVSLRRLK